ncbi:MAG TPA: histidinol dehydrogenase, partial [Acetobacteraceae bacterium]|nr:histidinol dehydrogenase [Acetobacteraceae bacterium]
MRRLATADPGFEAQFNALLAAAREATERVDDVVGSIIAAVLERGDDAVIEYTMRFDGVMLTPDRLRISAEDIDAA